MGRRIKAFGAKIGSKFKKLGEKFTSRLFARGKVTPQTSKKRRARVESRSNAYKVRRIRSLVRSLCNKCKMRPFFKRAATASRINLIAVGSAYPGKKAPMATEKKSERGEEVDVISNAIGDFGRWQLYLTFLISLLNIPCTWHIFSPTFHARERELWCARPPQFATVDPYLWKNFTQPSGVCSIIASKFINVSSDGISILPGATEVKCEAWEFDNDGTTITEEFGLVCDRKHLNNVAEMMFLAGVAIGGLVGGVISDRYGRKKTLVACVFLQTLIGTLIAVAPWFEMYFILRAALGFISVSVVFSGFVLSIEIVGGVWRTVSGISYLFPVSLSYVIISGLAYLIRDWRHLQLAVSLPGAIFLTYWWLIPESPRWLLAMGRAQQVLTILQKAARCNKRELPQNIDKQLLPSTTKTSVDSVGVMDLFRTAKMRKITLLQFVIWFSVYLVYYGLVLNMGNIGGDLYVNSILSGLVEVPAIAISIAFLLKMGRRWPLSLTMQFAGLACLLTIPIPYIWGEIQWLTTTFTMSGKFLISSSNAVMPVFTAELFPTTIRNIGVGASNVSAGIALMLVPYLWELAAMHACVPMAVVGGCGLIGGLCVLFLPETGNAPLRDSLCEDSESEIKS